MSGNLNISGRLIAISNGVNFNLIHLIGGV